MRKPNLFIAGAARAGTTSLYEYLRKHPMIFGPDNKEPRFLSASFHKVNNSSDSKITIIRDESEYFGLYSGATDEKYIMDGSVEYMDFPEVAGRIKEMSCDAKVIISLRNPVGRMISNYRRLWNKGITNKPFEEFVEFFLEKNKDSNDCPGMYYLKLKNMFEVLGRDNVKVVLFDDLASDTAGVLAQIHDFLGIENIVPDNIDQKYYSSKSVLKGGFLRKILTGRFARKLYKVLPKGLLKGLMKVPETKVINKEEKTDIAIKQKLMMFFMDDIVKTEGLTGFDLSAWKICKD